MIKILTKKKQIKILKQLVANECIFERECNNVFCFDKYAENVVNIAYDVAGIKGIDLARELRKDLRKKVE